MTQAIIVNLIIIHIVWGRMIEQNMCEIKRVKRILRDKKFWKEIFDSVSIPVEQYICGMVFQSHQWYGIYS